MEGNYQSWSNIHWKSLKFLFRDYPRLVIVLFYFNSDCWKTDHEKLCHQIKQPLAVWLKSGQIFTVCLLHPITSLEKKELFLLWVWDPNRHVVMDVSPKYINCFVVDRWQTSQTIVSTVHVADIMSTENIWSKTPKARSRLLIKKKE